MQSLESDFARDISENWLENFAAVPDDRKIAAEESDEERAGMASQSILGQASKSMQSVPSAAVAAAAASIVDADRIRTLVRRQKGKGGRGKGKKGKGAGGGKKTRNVNKKNKKQKKATAAISGHW